MSARTSARTCRAWRTTCCWDGPASSTTCTCPACWRRRSSAARMRHALVRGIDKAAALALPGVHAVFTLGRSHASSTRSGSALRCRHPATSRIWIGRCSPATRWCMSASRSPWSWPTTAISPRMRPRWSRWITSRCRRLSDCKRGAGCRCAHAPIADRRTISLAEFTHGIWRRRRCLRRRRARFQGVASGSIAAAATRSSAADDCRASRPGRRPADGVDLDPDASRRVARAVRHAGSRRGARCAS